MGLPVLPDDVLLVIFYFYLVVYAKPKDTCRWQILVHVCRRWRSLVFGSPRRLDLKLLCTPKTPARDSLDIWPALPLIIQGHIYEESDVDNIIAALERRDRVCKITLTSRLEEVLASMQEPFPDLTSLALNFFKGPPRRASRAQLSALLSGSVPRLQSLKLTGLSFSALPSLLPNLSAAHLVHLSFTSSLSSRYISPETIANCLPALICLESLCLDLPLRPYIHEHPPSLARVVLPFLTSFELRGAGRYLDNLVALIDAPQLEIFKIHLSDIVEPDTPELLLFIRRTPSLTVLDEARMVLRDGAGSQVTFSSQTSRSGAFVMKLSDSRGWSNVALWPLIRFGATESLFSPLLSTVENFYMYEDDEWKVDAVDDVEDGNWVEVLRPFAAVKNLYLSGGSVRTIADTLGSLSGEIEAAAEVLPDLQKIFLDKMKAPPDVMENITRFVNARMGASRPSQETALEGSMQSRPTIAVSLWDVDWDVNPFDEGEDDDSDSDEDRIGSEDEDEDEDDGN